MMQKTGQPQKPSFVVREKLDGYEVDLYSYTTEIKISVDKRVPGVQVVSAKTSSDGAEKASMVGVIGDGGAEIDSIYPAQGLEVREGLAAVGALLASLEEALRRRGVGSIKASTHPTFARFMGQMGYVDSGVKPDADDTLGNVLVVKDISGGGGVMLPKVLELHEKRGSK